MNRPQYKKIGWRKYVTTCYYYIRSGIENRAFIITNKDGDTLARQYNNGILEVFKGYQWDGASGPVIQNDDIVCESLVHDILCQAIEYDLIPSSLRHEVDKLFHDRLLNRCLYKCNGGFLCRQTCKTRAWYVYKAVCLYVWVFKRDKI